MAFDFCRRVIVRDEKLGVLLAGFVPLCDVGESCRAFDNDAGTGVQLSDLGTVIVGEQELSLHSAQCVCQSFMILSGEAHVLVVILGVVIRWITVEEGLRSVVLLDKFLEVFVFDNHLLQSLTSVVDQREVVPHRMRLRSEGVKTGCIAVSDELIEICGSLDVRDICFGMHHFSDVVKIQAGVEHIPQFIAELIGMISDTAVEVCEIWIEVVVYLEVSFGSLMEKNPATAAEHFDVTGIVEWKTGNDLISQSFLATDPAHKAVQGTPAFPQKAEGANSTQNKRPSCVLVYTQNGLTALFLIDLEEAHGDYTHYTSNCESEDEFQHRSTSSVSS